MLFTYCNMLFLLSYFKVEYFPIHQQSIRCDNRAVYFKSNTSLKERKTQIRLITIPCNLFILKLFAIIVENHWDFVNKNLQQNWQKSVISHFESGTSQYSNEKWLVNVCANFSRKFSRQIKYLDLKAKCTYAIFLKFKKKRKKTGLNSMNFSTNISSNFTRLETEMVSWTNKMHYPERMQFSLIDYPQSRIFCSIVNRVETDKA